MASSGVRIVPCHEEMRPHRRVRTFIPSPEFFLALTALEDYPLPRRIWTISMNSELASSGSTPILAGLAAILALACLAVAIRSADIGAPMLGDIVSFDNGTSAPASGIGSTGHPAAVPATSGDLRFAPITAIIAGTGGMTCVLDPAIMDGNGGSFLVAGMDGAPNPSPFRIHWLGGATSLPGTDCGTDTEIMLDKQSIHNLAVTAGGVGAGPNKSPIVEFPSLDANMM